jgi:phospholipid/cholesterol/gamma-HCH transport system substrate-binding protein
MRRVALGTVVALALIWVSSVALFGGGDEGYLVRAYFDNGSFTVSGQDVRVGGANVGVIEEVDVSLLDEKVSNEPGKEVRPGTAVVVMRIEDPGYQDFRQDASCILRPQSLIGERFVDCQTTEPRADSAEAPPPLEEIPEGQPGAGQLLLPLENTGHTVDLDLLNNIYREPYRDRFRLVLNELGAGFATRGKDLKEIIERADPTLREGNKVLEKLARQRKTLARLTRDSDQILRPLAQARGHVVGFLKNAAVPARVTAERRVQLEDALARFPRFLRELRSTMGDLDQFSTAAAPVLEDLGVAAPDITRATKALEPFSEGSTTALKSLGKAGEKAGPLLVEAHPIVRKAGKLAKSGVSPTRNLDDFLSSVRRSEGFDWLMKLIYNTTASYNGFDQYGTYLRTYLLPENCVDYLVPTTFDCNASFRKVSLFSGAAKTKVGATIQRELKRSQPTAEPAEPQPERSAGPEAPQQSAGGDGAPEADPEPEGAPQQGATAASARRSKRAIEDLYSYLIGA